MAPISQQPLEISIPSLSDGRAIRGRVYLPTTCRVTGLSKTVYAAVLGHPFATLGGSQDDPVVLSSVGYLRELGFIVGTFDFR